MVEELFNKTFGKVFSSAEYEQIEDSPGENINLRVTLPFYNLDREENLVILATYDEKEKLFQMSDLGFCRSKIENLDNKTIREHKNFIRANGFTFSFSSETDHFFVLSPVVGYDDENVNITALIGHYLSVVLSYNE